MATQQCDQTIFSPSSTFTPYKIPTSVTFIMSAQMEEPTLQPWPRLKTI